MTRVTGEQPAMWGESIVGFGERRLRYAGGRELDWFVVGFAPRRQALTIYLGEQVVDRPALLARPGPHTTGKGCLYLRRLDRVDPAVLEELIAASVRAA